MRNLLLRILSWVARLLGAQVLQSGGETTSLVLPPGDRFQEAVRRAFVQCGLPLGEFRPDFRLTETGKAYEVLIHASRHVDKNHELHTVQDIIDWLKEAPRA